MDEDAALFFVRNRVPSAWALELLLLLHRDPQSRWSCEALVRELRGTLDLVTQNLSVLIGAGLAAAVADGYYAYRPHSPEAAALVDDLAALYALKPVTVLKAIFARGDKLR